MAAIEVLMYWGRGGRNAASSKAQSHLNAKIGKYSKY
jgi:hypothetical protein